MDRKALSTIAVLATAFAINQHQPIGSDAAAAQAGVAGAQTGHSQTRAAQPPAGSALDPEACGIGAVCDALIPYRETGPWTASCAWFGTHVQPSPNRSESVRLNSNAAESLGGEPGDWCLPAEATPTLNFLVVMVPDPVTTHLALYFDRTIEVLEAAAQQHSLFLDRYWLPWPVPGGTTPPGDTAQDFRVTAILNTFRLGQPGMMIFSAHDKQTCPAAESGGSCVTYAFLVSESPTSGINKIQFENAVRYAGVLSRSRAPAVHVVGPFFSGSTPSAIALARSLPPGGAQLDFVSGTMTNRVQADELRANVKFKQTLHDDSQAQDFMLEFLHRRGLTKTGGNVAILQEDETRYGNTDLVNDTDKQFPKLRYIKFPRELSRLRNASTDNSGAAATAPAPYLTAPSDEISWNWKDAAKDEDSVPAFSGQQGPLSQQAVLLSISDIIRQENIKYIGIAATDIFDILFLSKFLKISAPNTRVFVLDSDLLMVKASAAGRELDGTLTVTTYPLLARNADWTHPGGRQRSIDVFPSRITQGIYNAVLFQLDPKNYFAVREYADPLFDPSDRGQNDRPPLWLTMVGRTGFWAMSREKNLPSDHQAAPSPLPASALTPQIHARLTFDPPDGTSLLLQAALLIWASIHLSGLIFAKKAKYSWFRQFHIRSVTAHTTHAQHQTYYLFCGTLALSVMLGLIAISAFCLSLHGRIALPSPEWFPYLFPTFYVSVAIVGMALAGYAVWIAGQPVLKAVSRRYLLPSLVFYAVTVLLWSYLNSWRDGDGMFFALRAISFSNEVSPLLPIELLLLMYYLWAWTFIRKVRLSESKQVEIPAFDLLGPAGHGLENYLVDLRAATDDVVFNPQIAKAVTIGFAAVILFVLRPWETLRSVEGGIYDSLVILLVLCVCLIIVLVWGRYLYIWNRLRRILRGLERTPLRWAFSRFPNTYAWSPLWYEDAERRAYAISARSVECFQALVARGGFGELGLPLSQEMARAFQRVVALDTDDADENQRSTAVYELQNIFGQTTQRILDHNLRDRWVRDGGSDTLDQTGNAAAEKQADPAYQCRLLAEEFVALRFVGLIHYQSAQLKNLVALLGIGFVVAVLAVGSYPFLAARQCVWSLAAVFVVFGAAVIISFAQMARDAVLSRLNGTVAGHLDWSFYLRALSYGGLPLLTLLASQFPSFGRSLSTWLEPALNALH
jgi:hypothetical protein